MIGDLCIYIYKICIVASAIYIYMMVDSWW